MSVSVEDNKNKSVNDEPIVLPEFNITACIGDDKDENEGVTDIDSSNMGCIPRDVDIEKARLNNAKALSSSDDEQTEEAHQAKLTIDLVNKNPVDPKALDVAKQHNLPPSIIYSANPVLKKLVEQFSSPQLDPTQNTPVTFRYMQNAEFAAQAKDDVILLQQIEHFYNKINDAFTLPKLWDETEQEHRARLQSSDTLDNLKYGMMSMATGAINLSAQANPLQIAFTNLFGKGPFDSLVASSARLTEEMPRDFYKEDLTDVYNDGGLLATIGSLYYDYDRTINLFAQELPSIIATRKFIPGDTLKAEYLRGLLKDMFTGSVSNIVEGANNSKSLQNSLNKSVINAAISNLSAFVPVKTSSNVANYLADNLISTATSMLAKRFTEGSASTDDFVITYLTSIGMMPLNKLIDGSLHNDVKNAQLEIINKAKDSNFVKKYPQVSERLIGNMLNNSRLKNTYINAEAFYRIAAENNLDAHQIIAKITGDSDYLSRALLSKGNIDIPTEKFITQIATNIDIKHLQDYIKYSTNEFTNNEKALLNNNPAESQILDQQRQQNTIDKNFYIDQLKKQLDKGISRHQAEQNALATLLLSKTLTDVKSDNYLKNIKQVNIVEKNDKAAHFIRLDNVNRIINLNNNKEINLTTYLQDTTPLFLNSSKVLNNAKNRTLIQQFLKADDITSLTSQQHNKWVKAFDQYMKTGHLDDQSIKPVFDQYKQVITSLYKDTQVLGINFDAETRQTLDLLNFIEFTTNYSASYQPVFSNAGDAGMNVKDYANYQQRFDNSTSYVSDNVFHQRVADTTNERLELWRGNYKQVKQQATKDADSDSILKLRKYLEKGIQNDGSRGELVKIDQAILLKQYGSQVAKQLADLTQKNGMSLESFADTWGFKSTDEMVHGLLYGPKNKKEYINRKTNNIMEGKYSYLLDRADIVKQVQRSLESKERESILATEEVLLQQKYQQSMGKRISSEAAAEKVMSNDLLRAMAKKIVKEKVIKPDDLDSYLITMRRENSKAASASKKKDWKAALESKNAERLNFYLYHEAMMEINKQSIQIKNMTKILKQTKQ